MIVATLSDLDGDFVVGKGHNFVSHEFLLVIKLIYAGGIEAKEAGGEENCVFEVSLDLGLHCVANNALLCLKSDTNTAKKLSENESGITKLTESVCWSPHLGRRRFLCVSQRP